MKFLLVIVVVAFVLWLMFGRGRRADAVARRKRRQPRDAAPIEMVACAHCGVHLPKTDAFEDGGGRPYCGQAHRVAGPR